MSAEDRIEQARLLYERAVFDGDASGEVLATADRELDGVEADLALARGRILHTRFLEQRDHDPDRAVADPRELVLFERAAELYRDRDGHRPRRCPGRLVLRSRVGRPPRPGFQARQHNAGHLRRHPRIPHRLLTVSYTWAYRTARPWPCRMPYSSRELTRAWIRP